MTNVAFEQVEWRTPSRADGAKRARGRIRDGLEFEAKAQLWLNQTFGPSGAQIIHSRWIRYVCEGEASFAQPDSVVVLKDRILLFEIKLRHTRGSAEQLARYSELLSVLLPGKPIVCIELYRYWDWFQYPAECVRLSEVDELMAFRGPEIGLYSPVI